MPIFSFVYLHSIVYTGLIPFIEYGICVLSFHFGPIADKAHDKRYLISSSSVIIGFSSLILSIYIYTGKLGELTFAALIAIMAVGHDIVCTGDWTVDLGI